MLTRGSGSGYHIPCSLTHQRSNGIEICLRQTDKIAGRNLRLGLMSIVKGVRARKDLSIQVRRLPFAHHAIFIGNVSSTNHVIHGQTWSDGARHFTGAAALTAHFACN